MTKHGAWALGVVSLAFVAGCGEDPGESGGSGGDGGSGDGGATSAAETSSAGKTTGSSSNATSTTAASSSTGGEPCDPLKNADDLSPTPGHCDGDVAVTCGQDGFLVFERCNGGTECREYELSEWRFNGLIDPPVWEPARTVDWAACLPVGAESCPVAWNGNYYWMVDPPHCEGASKIMCRNMPAPDLFSNYPQLQYGSETGWLSVVDCPSGEKCAGSDTIDQLTCIDEDTPACDGTEPSCAGDAIEYCAGTWESLPGYKVLYDCTPGLTCYEGTSGPFCREPGEVPCDDATFDPVCTGDASAIVSCYNGWTSHQSCATCFDGAQQVPCRCDDLATATGWSWNGNGLDCSESHGLACVPQAAADCDPDVDVDVCNGAVAHRCVGHWDDIDCGALGQICEVAAGRAGCRDANAPACDPWSFQQSCDGDVIVSCCACDRSNVLFGPPPAAPCVTGYEVRADCGAWGPYVCDPPEWMGSPWAECVFMP